MLLAEQLAAVIGGGESSVDSSLSKIAALAACDRPWMGDAKCYILGGGDQPAHTAWKLAALTGVEIVWRRSLIPWWLAPVRAIVASYQFLVRVRNPLSLKPVFETLAAQSVAVLYIVDALQEREFISAVKQSIPAEISDFGVTSSSGFLIFILNTDDESSGTAASEKFFCGPGVPSCELEALQSTSGA